MARRIVLVKHNNDPADDRAAAHLVERGFAIAWRFPFAGDRLPEPDGELAGTVIYGGGQAVTRQDRYPFLVDELRWIEGCMRGEVPVLGICLGSQLLAHQLGATVGPHPEGMQEFGYYRLKPTAEGAAEIPEDLHPAQSHYHTFDLPAGATRLASSDLFENQAFHANERTYGLQFHPEQTPAGFGRWQSRPWAPWGRPGVQSRAEQDRLQAAHAETTGQWFRTFLDRLFGLPND